MEIRLNVLPSDQSEASDLYLAPDLDIFPVGDGLYLVHSKGAERPRLLRQEIVNLLAQCRDFRTLEEHADLYCRECHLDRSATPTFGRELRRLANDGFLLSRNRFLQELFTSPSDEPVPPIATIGFPTCDRVEQLQASLSSYIEHCQRFGRGNDFAVMDDSADPSTRRAYRHMLRALQSRYGVEIAYAGLEEKVTYIDRLVETGDVPKDIVSFALLGDKNYGVSTVGANRNTMLLHTVGDLIFSADDDTRCSVANSPAYDSGVVISSHGSPLETWFYRDRGAALKSVDFSDHDIFALHEDWLGKHPRASLATMEPRPEVHLEEATPQTLNRMTVSSGKTILTLNGSAGDCGWDNSVYRLFQRNASFARLAQMQSQDYQSIRNSREIVQAVDRVTITDAADPMQAMFMGLDNRELLPPFTPVGRAEDVAFGTMLSKCFRSVYAAHLPYVSPHLPAPLRSFSSRQLFAIGPGPWLASMIWLFEPGYALSPTERLKKLGGHLGELGRMSNASFDALLQKQIWQSVSSLTSGIETRFTNESVQISSLLAQDMRSYLSQVRQSALTPVDRLYMQGLDRSKVQQLLLCVGKMLENWFDIIEAARAIRLKGTRLAQPIQNLV